MDEYDRPDPRLFVSICQENGFYDLRVGENGFKYPGLVLIFNQITFQQTSVGNDNATRLEEPGYDLAKILTELGFMVLYHKDFTRVKIMNTIGKCATLRKPDNMKYASFLLFFLSHGNIKFFENEFHQILKTADDDMLISDIWKHFENTETWNNKPKCFVFQTCRGTDLVEGVRVCSKRSIKVQMEETMEEQVTTEIIDSSPINRIIFESKGSIEYDNANIPKTLPRRIPGPMIPNSSSFYIPLNTSPSTPSIPFTEPKFSDLLIFHSTYQGAASFRESNYIAFVDALVTHFRNDIFTKDLLTILQNVQKDIAYNYHVTGNGQRDAVDYDQMSDIEGSRLMPLIETTLTGKICYENSQNIQLASARSSQSLPQHYDMKSGKGKVVIIANKYKLMENFPQMPYVYCDIEELKKSFDLLKCDVTVKWDLTASELQMTLNELGSQDYSEYDFFSLVFYGYGCKDYIVIRDPHDQHQGCYVEVSELWQPFFGSRCQTLIDKPKFFIISAIGIDQAGISGKFKRFVKKAVNIENTRALNAEAKCDPGETPQIYVIPEAADFLLLFHTASGTANYMDFMDDDFDEGDEEIQSIFFQKLNEELQNAGDYNLLDLLQKFQYKMTKIIKERVQFSRDGCEKREVPLVMSTLTKKFVLPIRDQ